MKAADVQSASQEAKPDKIIDEKKEEESEEEESEEEYDQYVDLEGKTYTPKGMEVIIVKFYLFWL